MRCPNDGFGPEPMLLAQYFGCAQVDEVDFAEVVDNAIFGLGIAIDDVHRMQVLDGQQNGAEIVPGCTLGQNADFADGVVHLDPADVLEEQVDVLGILVGLVVADDQRVVDHRQNLPFRNHRLLHALIDDACLFYALQGVQCAQLTILDQVDLTELSFSQLREIIKVLEIKEGVLVLLQRAPSPHRLLLHLVRALSFR